jgi:hypothetical protein
MSFAFDTLAYARKLRDAKVPPEQAEAMADALTSAIRDNVAPRADLLKIENSLESVKAEVMLHRWLFGAMLALQLATLGAVITLFARLVR